MSVSDFVCYVLNVPLHLDGYIYVCRAIQYVVDHDGESGFYEYLQASCEKSYACIEKALRLCKNKAMERMKGDDFVKIFQGHEPNDIKVKEFICYAAHYYRKEFMNED